MDMKGIPLKVVMHNIHMRQNVIPIRQQCRPICTTSNGWDWENAQSWHSLSCSKLTHYRSKGKHCSVEVNSRKILHVGYGGWHSSRTSMRTSNDGTSVMNAKKLPYGTHWPLCVDSRCKNTSFSLLEFYFLIKVVCWGHIVIYSFVGEMVKSGHQCHEEPSYIILLTIIYPFAGKMVKSGHQ